MMITKIEAKEACDWLQAAGFPQYVQLFKDCRVPIDIEWAKRDHHFLDEDALDSLCRRLSTLNKSVEMRLEPRSKRRGEDLKEEDFCAISPNWTYDRRARRWRRLDPPPGDIASVRSSGSAESEGRRSRRSSAHGMLPADPSVAGAPSSSPEGRGGRGLHAARADVEGRYPDKPPRKKGTSLLRKMERLRLRAPTGLGVQEEEEERRARLHGTSSPQVGPDSRSSSSPSSPHAAGSSGGSDSRSESNSSSNVSTPSPVARARRNCKRPSGGDHRNGTEDYRNQNRNNNNNSSSPDRLIFQIPSGHKPGTFPTSLAHKHSSTSTSAVIDDASVNWRTGSFHGRRGGPLAAADHRLSVYDNVPDDQPPSAGEGGSVAGAGGTGEESGGNLLLAGEDVFSALDGVLERISNLQQMVSTWSENLSEEDRQRGSSSSSSSTSSSQDSPGRGSSAASPCPSSPSHVHLEEEEVEEEEEEEGEGKSPEEGQLNGEEPKTRSPQPRCR
ncbi:rho GTPase-activating protein 7 [Pungitius pungitius]|uniref:rho GTPase-activating protein 7 n=1 Tax=Pungitius pungitius TaxID=134920 RepID=UPI002E164D14